MADKKTEKVEQDEVNEEETMQEDTQSDSTLQKKIEELETEVATLKDTLLRKLAETENLRKRLEKEKNDAEKYANGKFAKDLLSVIDNFDRVTNNLSAIEEKIKDDATLKPFFNGVSLCGKELLSVFKKHGITQVEVSEGTRFDPHYHQAMCEIESKDHKPGTE